MKKISRIKSIRKDKTQDVFDITVEGNHNFVANGIVISNCVEVSMYGRTEDGRSGWQVCNLTEINGAVSNTKEEFFDQCKAASILGTLQAGYTKFDYLESASREIIEKEALIGVGITGWMNNPKVLFDESNQREGAEVVKKWNKITADIIGINQAARTTVVKPSGNACQTFDGKIKTNQGIKTLREIFNYFDSKLNHKESMVIEESDLMVYDMNNNLKPITGLYDNGIEEVFEIEFNGETYEFTENHKLLLETGEWKQVKNLEVGDDIKDFNVR